MTVRQVGDALAGRQRRADSRRTHQKCHGGSRYPGQREQREWAQFNRFDRREHRARLRTLAHLEREEREQPLAAGKRRRPKSAPLRDVYEFMLKLRGRVDGRLEPTYAFIAAELGHSLGAVKAAMKRLKGLGLLRWFNRVEVLDEPTPEGQYVAQIANAYVHELAGRASALVRLFLGLQRPSPPPGTDQPPPTRRSPLGRAEIDKAAAAHFSEDFRRVLKRLPSQQGSANPSE